MAKVVNSVKVNQCTNRAQHSATVKVIAKRINARRENFCCFCLSPLASRRENWKEKEKEAGRQMNSSEQ